MEAPALILTDRANLVCIYRRHAWELRVERYGSRLVAWWGDSGSERRVVVRVGEA